MRFGNTEIELLSDGSFTLEVGACFGVVPKKIWSKNVTENENNRVRMAINVPLIMTGQWNALIDSGVGRYPNERMRRIYEIDKSSDLLNQVEEKVGEDRINYIVHSHLHFDHMGHSFEVGEKISFPNATRIAQKDEFHNMMNTNEVTRGSYVAGVNRDDRITVTKISGDSKIKEGLRVVKTGGHTSGHETVIYEEGGKGLIYFGDIVPAVFNLKLPYITAIDTYPLDTLEMKKKLISLAIDKKYVCVFNHDSEVRAAYLSGSVDKVGYEPVEL